MADEEMKAGISAKDVETSEQPFEPPASVAISEDIDAARQGEVIQTEGAAKSLFVELEPSEQSSDTFYPTDYLSFYKTLEPEYVASYKNLPKYSAPPKELIVNLETTGVLPWESRVITIGVLDPNQETPEVMQFRQENEEQTIMEFVNWFNSQAYDTFVSYNAAFDYRYLYALMQRYRLQCPAWPGLEIYDLQTQQEQVKQSFVPGNNKSGTLEQWCTYLFGTQPYAEQEQVFAWYKDGNFKEIENYNADKIVKAYLLFTLNKIVASTLPTSETPAETLPAAPPSTTGLRYPIPGDEANEIEVTCQQCKQAQWMAKSAKVVSCWVCGTPILNPTQ